MKKKTDLSEILTQAEFKSTEEDTYSSEERAKAEAVLTVVEDFADNHKGRLPGFDFEREALIQQILDIL